MDSDDLSAMPDETVMILMAEYLKTRQGHPVGSRRWAGAVLGYEACKREMDRRLIAHIVDAARKEHGEPQ